MFCVFINRKCFVREESKLNSVCVLTDGTL